MQGLHIPNCFCAKQKPLQYNLINDLIYYGVNSIILTIYRAIAYINEFVYKTAKRFIILENSISSFLSYLLTSILVLLRAEINDPKEIEVEIRN